MSLDFQYVYLGHSNLGGQGPDTSAPPTIRYINALSVFVPGLGTTYVDLEVRAESSYQPDQPSLNGLSGRFAQINLACNTEVTLRAYTVYSCATAPSCNACQDAALSTSEQITCYARGCACYGTTVYAQRDCMGAAKEAHKAAYSCESMSAPVMLPGEALVTVK